MHADVATDVIPGKTTNVTYKCNDPFVLDPNRPQFSTCDQLTGQWTAVPKCICADPIALSKCICADPPVPANSQIVSRTDSNVNFKFKDPFVLDPNGPQFSTCDQLTGHWTDLPICICADPIALSKCICADPLVPANAQIASYADFNVTYKCKDPFVLNQNGPQFSTCDRLTGHWTDLPICICADPPVPANGQIVSRTDFSIQFHCDFPFLLKGIDTVVCDEKTGTWDQLPSCKH